MKLSLGITPRDYTVAGGSVVYDTDAQAYFTANTAITSAADKNAINTFYLGLKSDGIYTKIKAMYLPIWGSAASCKWNLVNPLDTNAAFRLTFSTGWTFSSGGMTPTNAYAETFFVPSSTLTLFNAHMSFYNRTSAFGTTGTKTWMGAASNAGIYTAKEQFYIYSNATSSQIGAVQNSESAATDFAYKNTFSNRLGFWINSRTSSTATTLKLFRNGISEANATTSSSGQALNIYQLYIGAMRNQTISAPYASSYDNSQSSFISIGIGLTDTEANNFYNRVQTLMTYFGINV